MNNTLTFRFESGTNKEEILKILDRYRIALEKMGKSEVEIQEYVTEFLEGLEEGKTCCDNCRNEITKEEKEENPEYSFTCRFCTLRYDLCANCQKVCSMADCPPEFGCNGSETEEPSLNADGSLKPVNIFLVKPERKEYDSYEVADQKIHVVVDEKKLDIDTTGNGSLFNDIEKSSVYPLSILHVPMKNDETNKNHNLFRDMWLYFRSTDEQAIQQYGKPDTIITDLGSWKIRQMFKCMKDYFTRFISLDSSIDSTSSLLFSIVYPNGSQWLIRRLYPEEKKELNLSFICCFADSKKLENNVTAPYIEIFRETLEKSGRTVEEMTEDGQLLVVSIMTNDENV